MTKILDPEGEFLQQWNKIFVLCCVIAVSLDPLFFYIPIIDGSQKCLNFDKKLGIIACVLRSFTDIFYILHIFFQFRTAFDDPSSRVYGAGRLIVDPHAIAKKYLSSYFVIDILAVIPLPQVAVLIIIPNLNGPVSLTTKDVLKFVVFFQYVPRLLQIHLLYKEVTRTSAIFTQRAWAGAAFNLFLYMLASHVVGALWYLFTIERAEKCWRVACKKYNCNYKSLYCGENRVGDYAFLNASCPLLESNELKKSTDFDFGIYLDALNSRVVETTDFTQKFFYCSAWGLQSLSSIGQNIKTSTFVGGILFADLISILGLVLFSMLIGNMQKYLRSYSHLTFRVEEMKGKRRDAEQLMSHFRLPDALKVRIRRHEQYRWRRTRGVELESFVQNLPRDLRRDIKRHLCLDFLLKVKLFEMMDGLILDAMCDRLNRVLYTDASFIVREGDPVEEMLFVVCGNLQSVTTDGGRTGFYNSDILRSGDFCGEEILTWALDPRSSSSLPPSTRTVQAITDVEAFALTADDMKFVVSQFRRLHSREVQHTFRFYSPQWRTWAACFIQAAWRNHRRRKFETSLRKEEDRLQVALIGEGRTSPGLATIYASRFAANARYLLRNHERTAKLPHKLSPLLLPKPAEPDIHAEDH